MRRPRGAQSSLQEAWVDGDAEHTPDGRKCSTCLHKDDQQDPVMAGMSPPCEDVHEMGHPTEEGQYCWKIIASSVPTFHAREKAKGLTIVQWKRELGSQGEEALKRHVGLVEASVKLIILKGGNYGSKLNLDEPANISTKVTNSRNVRVQRPGCTFYQQDVKVDEYSNVHGDLLTDGLRRWACLGECVQGREGLLSQTQQTQRYF